MKIDNFSIEKLINPIVESMGYIIWNVKVNKFNGIFYLRIYVDISKYIDSSKKSISVDECSSISKQLNNLLSVEIASPRRYILEVSSPGVDRQLFRLEHYRRYIGNKICVVVFDNFIKSKKRKIVGKLHDVLDTTTIVVLVDDQIIKIAIENICNAKLIF